MLMKLPSWSASQKTDKTEFVMKVIDLSMPVQSTNVQYQDYKVDVVNIPLKSDKTEYTGVV